MRQFAYFGLLLAIIAMWVADRMTLVGNLARLEKQNVQDALTRQLAVVERDRSQLIAGFAEEALSAPESVDKYLIAATTSQLVRLWKHEKDIDLGKAERATVSGKRLLEALSCESVDDYFGFAERTVKKYYQVDDFERKVFLEMDNEELSQFCDFLQRASEDTVDYGTDLPSMMRNSPGEFRPF